VILVAGHRAQVADVRGKKLSRPVVLLTGMGSFDFVRLAPHFAQDDRVEKSKT
jgi:hypothetical protein